MIGKSGGKFFGMMGLGPKAPSSCSSCLFMLALGGRRAVPAAHSPQRQNTGQALLLMVTPLSGGGVGAGELGGT